jgi:hypothetical protein
MHKDPSDPAMRAARRLTRRLRAHRVGRVAAGAALALLGVALLVAAEPVTGDPGARVGAVVAALLLFGLAAAVWPWQWSPREHEHYRLDSIWRELRADAGVTVPWERYAAWAEADSESVRLLLLRCAPARPRAGGAPTPFSRSFVRKVDPDDVEAAAEAMESLRAEAAKREQQAEDRHTRNQLETERRRHEARLAEIDRENAEAIQAGEERMRRELAEQEAADRRAQADAVARALRRP